LLLTRGQVLEALGRTAEAIADYRRVLTTRPLQAAIDGLRRLGVSPSSGLASPRY
jgi:hypothetical protein